MDRSMAHSGALKRRKVEISFIALVTVLVFTGILAFVFVRQGKPADLEKGEICSPDFPEFSVNITGAKKDGGNYTREDGMSYPSGTFWVADGTVFGCPCSVKPCIRKCCPLDQQFEALKYGSLICVDSNTTFKPWRLPVYSILSPNESMAYLERTWVDSDHFFILHKRFADNLYLSGPERPHSPGIDDSFIIEDGTILTMDEEHPRLDKSNCCLESAQGSPIVYVMRHVDECSTRQKEWWVYSLLASGTLVSVPFLLLTLGVYALLPELHNLSGKSLMCQVTGLSVAYVALAVVQHGMENVPLPICLLFAFVVQFAFLTSFFWLNAMCFDIWLVFSGLVPRRQLLKEAEHKKFLIYSGYAWGGALFISVSTAILDLVFSTRSGLTKSKCDLQSCWFVQGGNPVLLYFHLPIIMLSSLNLMMLLFTSCRLRTHNIDGCRDDAPDRQRFNMYLKQFIVMGITWLIQLLYSMSGGAKIFWLASSLCNNFQGPVIFLIFVCNRRTLRLLAQRLCFSHTNQHNGNRSNHFQDSSPINVLNNISPNPDSFCTRV